MALLLQSVLRLPVHICKHVLSFDTECIVIDYIHIKYTVHKMSLLSSSVCVVKIMELMSFIKQFFTQKHEHSSHYRTIDIAVLYDMYTRVSTPLNINSFGPVDRRHVFVAIVACGYVPIDRTNTDILTWTFKMKMNMTMRTKRTVRL